MPIALGARNVTRNLRTPMLVVASLLQPVIWLVLFSQIFRRLADTPEFQRFGYDSYLEFFLPGMGSGRASAARLGRGRTHPRPGGGRRVPSDHDVTVGPTEKGVEEPDHAV